MLFNVFRMFFRYTRLIMLTLLVGKLKAISNNSLLKVIHVFTPGFVSGTSPFNYATSCSLKRRGGDDKNTVS